MPDFSKRSDAIEIMDDLSCSGKIIGQTLRELETINKLLGGNYVTIDGIATLLKDKKNSEIKIADLGCGSGDILRLIRNWARKKKFNIQLLGIDANPNIVSYAREHTPEDQAIQFEAIDILSEVFRQRTFDIVVGTLFFHHFTHEQLIAFFAQLKKQVRIGFIINDIHRHWFAFHSIKWLTQVLSRSSMVKNDAPLSVLRAFKKDELEDIMRTAGIRNYSIRWMWAFRWQVIAYTN